MKLAYDAQGQRFRKQIGTSPAVYSAYDLQGQLLGEYTLSGTGNSSTFKPLMEYIWLEGQPVAAVRPTPGAPANAPNSAQEVFYLHTDHLGTPRVALDTTGRVRWRWMGGEPFGLSPAETNPNGLGELNISLRLPGQQYDGFVGLHYNYFRDYDPTMGRYVQSDPIGVAGGINTYAYVGGNPVSYVDPLGLDRWGAATAPAVVLTFQKEGRTLFYDPATARMFSIPTNSSVASSSLPGAGGPYSGLVTMCQRGKLGKSYGTAKLRTTDTRSRWVHGGGSRSPNPYAPDQGWYPTEGCTRAQNQDIEDLCSRVEEYQEANYPNAVILYRRD